MARRVTWILALGIVALPAAAAAQVYDAPGFQPPDSERGVGFYAVSLDPGTDVSDDVAALATWRTPGTDLDLGLRVGAGDVGGDLALLGGVEMERGLTPPGGDAPLSVAWTGGMGVGTVPEQDAATIRIPVGLTVGREIPAEGYAILPYAHPRLALDFLVREDPPAGPGDDTELGFDLDLGADVVFDEGWRLRVGVTLGGSEAVGFGVSL